ncbi:MAG: ribonucleotide monophosphatase NagD (HAD superfamily) [Halobacteriales archaeon]|jgi:ribonucleotide monophosphatase NagD (HAD superfamily)
MTAIDGVVLDLDGTFVRGDELVPGVRDGWRRLQAADVDGLLFSNDPTRRPGTSNAWRRSGSTSRRIECSRPRS